MSDGTQRKGAFDERRLTAQDGTGLYYRVYGQAGGPLPDLLCLGGLTRNSKDFRLTAKRHMTTRRVIAPDYRGRGFSDYAADPLTYQPATYLDDVRHLLTAEAAHRVVVIGTSLGGLLAMGMAVSQPTVIRGAVLNDIGPDLNMGELGTILTYMRETAPLPDWGSAVARMQHYFPDFPAEDAATWEAIARATYKETPAGLVYDWDPQLLKPFEKTGDTPALDLWPLFKAASRLPLLSIRGERSALFPAPAQAAMKAAKPDLGVLEIAGVGHAPSLAEPAAVEAIDAFLARID